MIKHWPEPTWGERVYSRILVPTHHWGKTRHEFRAGTWHGDHRKTLFTHSLPWLAELTLFYNPGPPANSEVAPPTSISNQENKQTNKRQKTAHKEACIPTLSKQFLCWDSLFPGMSSWLCWLCGQSIAGQSNSCPGGQDRHSGKNQHDRAQNKTAPVTYLL